MKGLLKQTKGEIVISTPKNKDSEKLRLIYEKYKNRMYISACRILGDPLLAEDAVHDAFIAISRNIHRIQEVDSLSTASYVIKAAKSKALNMAKKTQAENIIPIEQTDEPFDDSLMDTVCEKQSVERIVSVIMSLDERYRDVLCLYYLNELTVSEIADILSRKETTVKQQLSRGRKRVIEALEKEEKIYGK